MSGASRRGRGLLVTCAFVSFAAAAAGAEEFREPHPDERTVTGRCITRTVTRRGTRVRCYYVVTETEVYLIASTSSSYSTPGEYVGRELTVTGRGVTLPDGRKYIYVTRLEDISVREDAPPWKGNVLVVLAGSRFSVAEYKAVKDALKKAGYKAVVASSAKTAVGLPEFRLKVDVLVTDVRHLKPYRGIVFCGGPGIMEYEGYPDASASARERTARLKRAAKTLLKRALEAGKLVGASSLAPAVVLAPAGVLKGKKVTGSAQGVRFWVFKRAGAKYTGSKVERDGNLVTARFEGMREFAKLLVKVLDENREAETDREGTPP